MNIKEINEDIERIKKLKKEVMNDECWKTSQLKINLQIAEAKLEGYKIGQKETIKSINKHFDIKLEDIKASLSPTEKNKKGWGRSYGHLTPESPNTKEVGK